MLEVDQVLEHFGVRGMHWGVRRNRKELDQGPASETGHTPFAVRRTPLHTPRPEVIKIKAPPGKGIQTKGGKNFPSTDEAQVAAVLRQRAKSSGVRSLSNKDIKVLIDRMSLEQQYSKLNPKKLSFGRKATEELLYGSTPQIGLAVATKMLAGTEAKPQSARVAKGLAAATAVIANRPKKKKA